MGGLPPSMGGLPPLGQRWVGGQNTVGPPVVATVGPTVQYPVGQRWPNSGVLAGSSSNVEC